MSRIQTRPDQSVRNQASTERPFCYGPDSKPGEINPSGTDLVPGHSGGNERGLMLVRFHVLIWWELWSCLLVVAADCAAVAIACVFCAMQPSVRSFCKAQV
jgi:hypothetical protein